MSTAKVQLARLLAPPRTPTGPNTHGNHSNKAAQVKAFCNTYGDVCLGSVKVQQTQKMERLQRSSAAYPKPKTAKDNTSFGKMSTILRQITTRKESLPSNPNPPNQTSQATIHYLTQYLNQLVLDNCKLKIDLNQRQKDVQWLQSQLLRKQQQTQLVKQSKHEIVDSVRRISEYNQSYIEELQRKNEEIDELKRRLLEARNIDDSDTDEGAVNVRPRLRYKELREEVMGKKEANLSTVSSSGVLESARKYVANVRGNVGRVAGYAGNGNALGMKKI